MLRLVEDDDSACSGGFATLTIDLDRETLRNHATIRIDRNTAIDANAACDDQRSRLGPRGQAELR